MKNPSKLVILIFFIVVMALLWHFLFSLSDDGSLAQIQQRGSLRVGLDASFPPFESLNAEGKIIGLDVDIAEAIATDLGVELQLVNIGFDGLYDALLARKADLILSGLPYDPRWTEDVAYTHTYFNAGQILMVRADEETIKTVEDLAGRTIAIEWGSQADMEGRQLAQTFEGLTLTRHETAAEAIEALLAQHAEAAIVDAVTGVSAFPRGLRVVSYLSDEWYVAAVHIESQALLERVNAVLSNLEEGGQMSKMQAKWLHGGG